jgi:hypothetical protein
MSSFTTKKESKRDLENILKWSFQLIKIFLFGGTQIHRLTNLPDEKRYTIQIGSESLKFTKMHIPFLSIKCFHHFEETDQPFIIDQFQSSGITLLDFVSWFRQLVSFKKMKLIYN